MTFCHTNNAAPVKCGPGKTNKMNFKGWEIEIGFKEPEMNFHTLLSTDFHVPYVPPEEKTDIGGLFNKACARLVFECGYMPRIGDCVILENGEQSIVDGLLFDVDKKIIHLFFR